MRRELLDAQRGTRFDRQSILRLQRQFQAVCTAHHTDAIDAALFARVLRASMGEVDSTLALRLFAAADASGDGKLQFKELATALSVLCQVLEPDAGSITSAVARY